MHCACLHQPCQGLAAQCGLQWTLQGRPSPGLQSPANGLSQHVRQQVCSRCCATKTALHWLKLQTASDMHLKLLSGPSKAVRGHSDCNCWDQIASRGHSRAASDHRAHRGKGVLTVKTNHAEVLLDLVQGSPLRSAAMAAAQLVSGACAQTHARGAAGQHSPSTPAHAKHTTLVKVEHFFQASNAQQRRGALTIRCPVEQRGARRW